MAGIRSEIIALVGIDGSGKSTHARLLAEWLTASGAPAIFLKNPGGRLWFGQRARWLGRPDAQGLLGRVPMLVIETVLRWLAIARSLVRARRSGRVAVMDRYSVCQYASIRAHRGRGERTARLLYRVFPPPDLIFLLVVPPMVAYSRIEQRGTDHERYEFLAASAAAYESLPEARSFVRIDADRPMAEVQAALQAALRDALPARVGPPSG